MQALIQLIKVNEARSGVGRTSGKPYTMQDAECILLNEDGSPSQVGVLMLPKDLTGKVTVGTYMGTFALQASLKDRRIEAVLTGLQPYAVKSQPAPKA
jgi:hypothetical protein